MLFANSSQLSPNQNPELASSSPADAAAAADDDDDDDDDDEDDDDDASVTFTCKGHNECER